MKQFTRMLITFVMFAVTALAQGHYVLDSGDWIIVYDDFTYTSSFGDGTWAESGGGMNIDCDGFVLVGARNCAVSASGSCFPGGTWTRDG